MPNKITIGCNSLEPESWQEFSTDLNVLDFCMEYFKDWPTTAKIYHGSISNENEVTPVDDDTIRKTAALTGSFFVVVFPAGKKDFKKLFKVLTYGLASYIMEKIMEVDVPNAIARGEGASSANNELAERTNKPRLNGRIPEIFGTVRSTPDLLSTYKVFENNQEVEYSYMCIGRGEYQVSDIRDDTTLVSNVAGSSVEIYTPFTSPNFGSPQLSIGASISEPLFVAKRAGAVNGQVLRAPNANVIIGLTNIRFNYPDEIEIDPASALDFQTAFQPGDIIQIFNADYTEGPLTVNLDGTYIAVSVTAKLIVLSNPAVINSDWDDLDDLTGDQTGFISPTLETNSDKYVGNFDFNIPDISHIYCNFVAPSGIYVEKDGYQYGKNVELNIGITPIDETGTATGAEEIFPCTLVGSWNDKGSINLTVKCELSSQGRCRVRALRTTPGYLPTSKYNATDEVKWRDLYAMVPVTNNDFGNCTTVHSATYATSSAMVIKERKLNMLVTRKIPKRVSGSTFTLTNYATNRADEILSFICKDSRLGNRLDSEIDFDSIYDTIAEVESYFGTEKAIEFCYTFDNENVSFEEMMTSVSNAVFCTPFRRGSQIMLNFECATQMSTLLFNHRNKVPGSERREVVFGNKDEYDGVQFEYVNPSDDSIVNYYLPDESTSVKPNRIQSVGVRNKLQAHFHAWRAWQKIRYQAIGVEFEATQEADILVRGDRILVADNTRTLTQDGEVVDQNGMVLTLSQNLTLNELETYSIFLQYPSGIVESIPITAGSKVNEVVLSTVPEESLALDDNLYARTTYLVVGSSDVRETAFLVAEKTYQSNFTSAIKALNYDERYYAHDTDFVNNIVDEDGNPTG